jgi:hypothetical protein
MSDGDRVESTFCGERGAGPPRMASGEGCQRSASPGSRMKPQSRCASGAPGAQYRSNRLCRSCRSCTRDIVHDLSVGPTSTALPRCDRTSPIPGARTDFYSPDARPPRTQLWFRVLPPLQELRSVLAVAYASTRPPAQTPTRIPVSGAFRSFRASGVVCDGPLRFMQRAVAALAKRDQVH